MNVGQSQWDTVRTPGDLPRLELVPSVPVFSAPVFFLFLTDHPCFLYRWDCPLCCSHRYLSWEWLLSGEPESAASSEKYNWDNMWPQQGIREQFCTHSRVKLVEPKEMGHFQSEEGPLSSQFTPELPIFQFPVHSSDKLLCYRTTNVLLAYHNLFIASFYFLL